MRAGFRLAATASPAELSPVRTSEVPAARNRRHAPVTQSMRPVRRNQNTVSDGRRPADRRPALRHAPRSLGSIRNDRKPMIRLASRWPALRPGAAPSAAACTQFPFVRAMAGRPGRSRVSMWPFGYLGLWNTATGSLAAIHRRCLRRPVDRPPAPMMWIVPNSLQNNWLSMYGGNSAAVSARLRLFRHIVSNCCGERHSACRPDRRTSAELPDRPRRYR